MPIDLEREIARAICAAEGWDPDGLNLNAPNKVQWELWIKRATKVLARLDALGLVVVPRKPTDDMLAACGNGECAKWAPGAWHTMISASNP